MKIVLTFFGSTLKPSGISVFIFELANALVRDGHEVYVIGGHEVPKTQTTIRNIFDVEKLPTIIALEEGRREFYRSRSSLQETMRIFLLWLSRGSRLLKTIAPDMIIVNGAVPLYSSAFKVVVCHDLEFRQSVVKLYDKILYPTFNVVAATSTEMTQIAPAKLGIKSTKVITMPTCIDTHKYTVSADERREHAILHVGTWADKNLEATVRAFCKLAKTDPSIKLYVVGDLWERPQHTLSKVKEEFSKRIHCVGKVTKMELRDLYSRVRVVSVPSIYRFPVLSPTALEALAAGTPVVGGSTAISRDLLIDGYDGFRVYPTDFKALSERILTLTTNRKLWSEMSVNARSVAEHFDASTVARKYVKLYESFEK